MDTTATDIDGYLAALTTEERATLEALRQVIRATAPDTVVSRSATACRRSSTGASR